MQYTGCDVIYYHTTRISAQRAYDEAVFKNPVKEVDMLEVHVCFSVTELVVMEDLGIAAEGKAIEDVLNGTFDRDGEVPCQLDGGLKCFGHPIGASGLRMAYEMYLQLLGRAGDRQIASPSIGLTHNLGGAPNRNVASVSILGLHSA
jgi:acetyl-CoA C-acetyltransferase